MSTRRKLDTLDKKKRISKCPKKKRELIVSTYRETRGSITDLAKTAEISRARIYQIFNEDPKIREEIDAIDDDEREKRKQNAVKKLDENVEAGLERAIEYTLEKEPRRERGKTVINKDAIPGPGIELYLGINQQVIIE